MIEGGILKEKNLHMKSKEDFAQPEIFLLDTEIEMLLLSGSALLQLDIAETFDLNILELEEVIHLLEGVETGLNRIQREMDIDTIKEKERLLKKLRFFLYMGVKDTHFDEISNICMDWIWKHTDLIIGAVLYGNKLASVQGILILRDALVYASKLQIGVSQFNYCLTQLIEAFVTTPQFEEIIAKSVCTIVIALESSMLDLTLFALIEDSFESCIHETLKQLLLLKCMKYYICFNRDAIVKELAQESFTNKSNTCALKMLRLLIASLERKNRFLSTADFSKPMVELNLFLGSNLNNFKLQLVDLYLIFIEVFLDTNQICPSIKCELLSGYIIKIYCLLKPLVETDSKQLPLPELKELQPNCC